MLLKQKQKKQIIDSNGNIYPSLTAAADKLEICLYNLSRHLHNPEKYTHVKGYVFKFYKGEKK